MINVEELLPIGSIVLLIDGQKRLMIAGVKQTNLEDENKEYDYLGVLYPEGFIGEDYKFLFNHEDIAEVIHRGYEDEERQVFLQKLSEFYK